MKFYKMLRYDLKNGIKQKIWVYLFFFVLCFIFLGNFYGGYLKRAEEFTGETASFTSTNLLFYLFQGKEAFSPELGNAFVFPVVWLLIFLLSAYTTLDYPFQNLNEQGIQVVTRIRKRKLWWLSKCAWVSICTVIHFFLCYLVVLIFCLIFGIEISFQYAAYANMEVLDMELAECTQGQVVLLVVLLPILTALAINIFQLCLGFLFQRIYCFMFAALILFASTYFQTPFAIGNFAMVKRSIYCVENGMHLAEGVWITGSIIVLGILFGCIVVRRFDILKKE